MFVTLILQDQSLIHRRSSVTKPSIGRCWKVGCSLYLHCHLSGSYATELRTMDGVPAHFTRSAMAWVPQWPLWGWESICSGDTLTETGVSGGYKLRYHGLYRYIEAKKNISFHKLVPWKSEGETIWKFDSVIVACDMTIHIRAWIKKGFAETAQVFLKGNTRPYYIKECSCYSVNNDVVLQGWGR